MWLGFNLKQRLKFPTLLKNQCDCLPRLGGFIVPVFIEYKEDGNMHFNFFFFIGWSTPKATSGMQLSDCTFNGTHMLSQPHSLISTSKIVGISKI